MRPRMRAIAFFFASFSLVASAQDTQTAQLDFNSSVEGCMTAERFGDEVAARVGRIVFTDDGGATVRVRVFADGEEAVASVEMGVARTTDTGGRNTRFSSRVFRDADCGEALEAAAAAIAVWIDEGPAVAVLGVIREGEATENALGALRGESFGVGGLGLRQPDDGRVALQVSSNREGLTFHIETNTGRGQVGARFFERLCVMPCETRVRPGVQQFGIAEGNGIAWALPALTEVREDSELFVNVRPASGWNIAGRWLFAAGLLLVAPIAIPLAAVKLANDDWGKGPLWASIGVSAGLLVGGVLMFSIADGGGTEVELRPLGAQ